MSAWIPLLLAVNTGDVSELWWDGGLLWAATSGGLEAWTLDGERLQHVDAALPEVTARSVGAYHGRLTAGLAHQGAAVATDLWAREFRPLGTGAGHPDGEVVAVLPDLLVTAGGLLWPTEARLPGLIADAVLWQGAVVAGTLDGELLVWKGGDVSRYTLPGPARDLEVVDGRVRIAAQRGAVIFDGALTVLDVPAVAAGPLWGTADGRLVEAEPGQPVRERARLPSPARTVEALPDGWVAVATKTGLYRYDTGGLRRWTPGGQLCGPFLMGATRFQGALVAASFDHGACVQRPDGAWEALSGLPSTMINDALATTDALWLATAAGLTRWDGARAEVFGAAGWEAEPGAHGVNHDAVNALAQGARLWALDVVGPTSIDGGGRWRRHRLNVYGTSYQEVAACGEEAWFASEDAGLTWTNGRRWRVHDLATGLPDDWVMAVACDGPGQAWAGTYQDGVWRYQGGRWRQVPGLDEPHVQALLWDGEALWVGTAAGLFRWQGGQWEPVRGVPSGSVHEITLVDGQILVATEAGLVVYGRG